MRLIFNCSCGFLSDQQLAASTIMRFYRLVLLSWRLHCLTIAYVSLLEINKPMHSSNILNAIKPNQRILDLCCICNFPHLMQYIYDLTMSAGLGANQNWRKKEIYLILIPKSTSIKNVLFCPEYHTKLLRLSSLQWILSSCYKVFKVSE
jgi:hypothetical protein